jgi:protein-S-isoprenylcysteine O-methyltransferase Ste14
MPKRESHRRLKIVRSAIREDVLYFALPALLVFTAGLVVSFIVGPGSLLGTLLELTNQPGKQYSLSWQNILGLGLFVVGLTIAVIAVVTLRGSYHSTLVIGEDHRLVTHLAIMIVLIPIIINRIRMEERLLIEEYGDAYREYQETTSKLVPFVY